MKFVPAVRLSALSLALALTTLAAHADTTFDWSLTGPSSTQGGFPDLGSGTLTATESGNQWTITSISGTFDDSSITGLIDFNGNDNLLFPGSTYLDTDGVSFETANGTEANIWSAYAPGSTDVAPGNNYFEAVGPTYGFGVGTFSLSQVAATPEPSALILCSTGLLGLAGTMRRRLLRS